MKLSKTSKLGCRSWSLEALKTCPASRDPVTGELVDACAGCYATAGNYRFPNVRAPRQHNRTDWKRDNWVSDMVSELDNDRYFRWFDSGDMYHPELAAKIYRVAKETPWVKHWIPTRVYKLAKFKDILAKLEALDNVVVRYSSDSIEGQKTIGKNNSTIGTKEKLKLDTSITICEAYENDGKCGQCRKCWDKQVETIGYVAHGRTMLKNIRVKINA